MGEKTVVIFSYLKKVLVWGILPVLIVSATLWAAQNYTVDCFNSTHAWNTDMQYIENNFAVLKSNYSGISAPSNAEEGMFWADSDDNILKLYNGSSWMNVMNYATGQYYIGDGFITASMFSANLRAPGVVWAQNIWPNNVTATQTVSANYLTSPTANFTTAKATNFYANNQPVLSWSSGTSNPYSESVFWTAVTETRVYIPTNANYLRMSACLRNTSSSTATIAEVYFTVGSSTSATGTRYQDTFAWVDEITANVSSMSGYQTVTIYLRNNGQTPYRAELKGYTFFYD